MYCFIPCHWGNTPGPSGCGPSISNAGVKRLKAGDCHWPMHVWLLGEASCAFVIHLHLSCHHQHQSVHVVYFPLCSFACKQTNSSSSVAGLVLHCACTIISSSSKTPGSVILAFYTPTTTFYFCRSLHFCLMMLSLGFPNSKLLRKRKGDQSRHPGHLLAAISIFVPSEPTHYLFTCSNCVIITTQSKSC